MTFDRTVTERPSASQENALALVVDELQFGIDGDRLATVPMQGEALLFLGRRDGVAVFISDVPLRSEAMMDFRAAAAVLAAEDIALMSYAQGMLQWVRRTRYCATCGRVLEARQSGHVRACNACNVEIYPRTDPAVMMLVTHRGKLLLAQHRGRIAKMWSTLAGFVEPGESLEEAAKRELAEETGLITKELRYFGSQSWPLPASLMIGFVMETESDALTIDESELLDARWYAAEELDGLELSSPISLSRRMIESWRASHRPDSD
jgi:NAD+ diphosphatase